MVSYCFAWSSWILKKLILMWSGLANSTFNLLEYTHKLLPESIGGLISKKSFSWDKPFWENLWVVVLDGGTNDCIIQRDKKFYKYLFQQSEHYKSEGFPQACRNRIYLWFSKCCVIFSFTHVDPVLGYWHIIWKVNTRNRGLNLKNTFCILRLWLVEISYKACFLF